MAKTSIHICFPPTTHSAEMVHSHTLADTTKHLRELGGEENKTAAKGQMYKSASKIRKRCLMFQRRHVRGAWVGSVAVQEGWGWGGSWSSRRDGRSRKEIGEQDCVCAGRLFGILFIPLKQQ